MNQGISESLLSQLSEMIAVHVGLHYPRERWYDLERGISCAAKDFGFEDIESCIQWLVSSPLKKNQIEILACNLTVGETYFFRDRRIFQILEEQIIPEVISLCRTSERCLRIWSAGCATGEEPYSLAIMLKKVIPDLRDWNITILATDINPRFLQKASRGVYTDWSFRDTPKWVKERFFEKTKEGYFKISSDIREMVTFSYLNLVENSYPSLLNNTSAMNIIFCRNALMYFTDNKVGGVVQKLYRSLVDGGWLVVSPCEISKVLSSRFVMVSFPDATLYRKDSESSQIMERIIPKETPLQREYDETSMLFQRPHTFQEKILVENSQPQLTLDSESRGRFQTRPYFERQNMLNLKSPYEEAIDLYQQGLYQGTVEKLTTLLLHTKGTENYTISQKEAIVLLIRAYANHGKLNEALEWCEKAIVMDKINPGFYYLRSTIFQEQGLIEESEKSLKRALYLDSNFTMAYFALGILSRKKGKLKESGKHLENALSTLNTLKEGDILPESDGITARRLKEIIVSTMGEI
jgi:chemotaxis protein methyltransferase CheR